MAPVSAFYRIISSVPDSPKCIFSVGSGTLVHVKTDLVAGFYDIHSKKPTDGVTPDSTYKVEYDGLKGELDATSFKRFCRKHGLKAINDKD